jgi:hypothetical protein
VGGSQIGYLWLDEGSCVFRNGLISISDWVFGNVWSCSTLFKMKTSHKSDELKNKKEGSTNGVPMIPLSNTLITSIMFLWDLA